ncbi:MAG: hypothetical protein ACK454_02850 [Flavobacteriales bacterium]
MMHMLYSFGTQRMATMLAMFLALGLTLSLTSCGGGSLCACKKKYLESLQKKATDKETLPQNTEKQSENEELKECLTLWKNASVKDQKAMLEETKQCR